MVLRFFRRHPLGTLMLLPVFVWGAPDAAAYLVTRGSMGNLIHLQIYDPAGAEAPVIARIRIVTHPAWVRAVEVDELEGLIEFNVAAQAPIDGRGSLLLELAGANGATARRRLPLEVAAEAPPIQHGTRIDECCIPNQDAEEATPIHPVRRLLLGNAPNPFGPLTRIRFGLPTSGDHAVLRVWSVDGRRVRRITTSELDAGYHQIIWDGLDERGEPVPPGIFFYELSAGEWSATRKMLKVQ